MVMPIVATVCHASYNIGETNSLRDTDRLTLEKTNIQAPRLEEVSDSSYKTFCIPVFTARGTPIIMCNRSTHRGTGSVIQLRMA